MIKVPDTNDEVLARDFVKNNGGEVTYENHYAEASFPKSIDGELSGKVVRASSWHNLVVLLTKSGRLEI